MLSRSSEHTASLDHASVVEWARALYEDGVDHKDAAAFAAVFKADAWLQFGNNEPIIGREQIQAAIAGFFTSMIALSHEMREVWTQGDTAVLEATVTYTRLDGEIVSVPAVTIYRLEESAGAGAAHYLARKCQIYVDLAPLYAPN